MYLMIDNYDSFVYNLASYFREIGEEIQVVRNDRITVAEIEKMENLEGIIISPGPKTPEDGGVCLEVLDAFQGKLPILGVCLGHQIIAWHYKANVHKGHRPMHGKVTDIRHNRGKLFRNLPETYKVTRYHSLIVEEATLPENLMVDAVADDGAIMSISHKDYPIYGIQFHPEAVLTEYGHEILENFVDICKEWGKCTWKAS